MNNTLFKIIAFVFACPVFAQYPQAQIKLLYNERDSYLLKAYGMTPKQVKDYNKATQTSGAKWNELCKQRPVIRGSAISE